ncbi:MAG: hypothetical protein MK110_16020 [Fuerstiella sp.]|nr:hypothetical protein [Fuerstiella sp.]
MSETILQPADHLPSGTTASGAWTVSLAFWMILLSAALIYGSVAVAPRLYTWINIRHDFIQNAHQLNTLETEVDYLERVRDALESDPEFVRRMADASIAEGAGDGELIPVSGELLFGSEDRLQERMPELEVTPGTSVAQRLAVDRTLRGVLLGSAGLLVVFAFTVLNGTGGRFVALVRRLAAAAVRLPLARYFRIAPPPLKNAGEVQAAANQSSPDRSIPRASATYRT